MTPAGHQAYCVDAALMTIGPLPDAMKPGIHCVRTHWIRGFMAFQLVRRIEP
jgi:hypothetical protein